MESTIEARMTLVESAMDVCRLKSYHEWLDEAPQWAIDRISRRELEAIYYMFWEPSTKKVKR
jgi:hypothetical protein